MIQLIEAIAIHLAQQIQYIPIVTPLHCQAIPTAYVHQRLHEVLSEYQEESPGLFTTYTRAGDGELHYYSRCGNCDYLRRSPPRIYGKSGGALRWI
ncbi:MAG: hypothetical protein VKK42_06485 [Lyngbya sp.]|nr:hypothetical protein [Lyngbya sp.]